MGKLWTNYVRDTVTIEECKGAKVLRLKRDIKAALAYSVRL